VGILLTEKELHLDRNLSRLLVNLIFAGSLNLLCSAATLITHDMKRLGPCAVRLVYWFPRSELTRFSIDQASDFSTLSLGSG